MSPDARHDAQNLLEALPLPSYIYELGTGRVLGANAAFCALLGYSLDDMRDMQAPMFYAAEERDRMWHLLRTLPMQGTGDRRFQRRTEEVFSAQVRYRNTELMNARREFISTRLVVILSHDAAQQPAADCETEQPVANEK